jgi:DNA modification methylase
MSWKPNFPLTNRYYENDMGILYNGNCLEVLMQFPDDSIDCVITSPPYWGLRDYGVDGQIGLEETFHTYLEQLLEIFDEVYRVLKPSGTCWVNLGDTYGGSGAGTTKNVDIEKYKQNAKESYILPGGKAKSSKLRNTKYNKSLLMIPERFAIGMIERGWVLRNKIVWHKPNAMPSSAKDRFTVDYEYIFFFTKNKKYYFKQQFEQNKSSDKTTRNPLGRNKRCVWSINTKPFKGAHFAVFPPDLPKICIETGSPKKVCSVCGKPVIKTLKPLGEKIIGSKENIYLQVEREKPYDAVERKGNVIVRDLPPLQEIKSYLNKHRKKKGYSIDKIEEIMNSQAPHHWFNGESYPTKADWLRIKEILELDDTYDQRMTTEYVKSGEKLKTQYKEVIETCMCGADFQNSIILDIFNGSGTTSVVAQELSRNWIGIELNADYCEIAKQRIGSNHE